LSGVSLPVNRDYIPHSSPRIRKLANLSLNLLSFHFSRIDLKLFSDDLRSACPVEESLLGQILRRYYIQSKRYSRDRIQKYILFKQTIKQLKNLGVYSKISRALLEDLGRLASGTDSPEESVSSIVQRMLKLENMDGIPKSLIVGLNLFDIEISLESMYYDLRFSFEMKNFSAYDYPGTALLDISTSNVTSIRSEGDQEIESEVEFSSPAVHLSMVSKSETLPFGEGGYGNKALYRDDPIHEARTNEWVLDVGFLSIEFDASSVLKILNESTNIKNRILSKFRNSADTENNTYFRDILGEIKRGGLLPSKFYRPFSQCYIETTNDFLFKDAKCEILMATAGKNFCFVSMENFQGMFRHSQQNVLRGSIGNVRLLDLTVTGKRYRDVIWNSRGATRSVMSFLLMSNEVEEEDRHSVSLVLKISDIRACFIYRFLLQAIEFFSKEVAQPICEFIYGNESLPDKKQIESSSSLEVFISIDNGAVVIPRNSLSKDLIGLAFESAFFHIFSSDARWEPPSLDLMHDLNESLIFDSISNTWERSTRYPRKFNDFYGQISEFIMESEFDQFDSEKLGCILSKRNPGLGKVSRIVCCPRHIDVFTSVMECPDDPDSTSFDSSSIEAFQFSGPLFNEVSHGERTTSSRETAESQRWQIITRKATHLDVVIDIYEKSMNLLFCDSRNYEGLDLALSQSEFYLILAFWFDNFHEIIPDCDGDWDPNIEGSQFLQNSALDTVGEFGSTSYFSYLVHRQFSFEILVVQGMLTLAAGLDRNYFEKQIPSHDYLTKYESMSRSDLFFDHPFFQQVDRKFSFSPNSISEVYPLCQIVARGIVVYVKSDLDVVHIGVTVGKAKIFDGRIPVSAPSNLVLEVLDEQGDNDLYRFDILNFDEFFPVGEPLDFSYNSVSPINIGIILSTRVNWMHIQVLVASANMIIHNLDLSFLIGEFFSCYFRFQGYGNPAIDAFYVLDPVSLPYGGTDFKLFLKQPHVSIVETISSSGAFVESDSIVMYRYTFDTSGSYKVTYDLQHLTLVLVPEFNYLHNYRGSRGSSGFGSSKTIIEFMTLFLFQHYNRHEDTEDFKLEIFPSTPNTKLKSAFGGRKDVAGVEIVIPEANFQPSPGSITKYFPDDSCDIVISFEDIVLLIGLIRALTTSPQPSTDTDSLPFYQKISHFCLFARINGIKALLIDNVLGMHLPFFQVCFSYWSS
jgi:hypothetical protein